MTNPAQNDADGPTVKSGQDARAGSTPHMTRYILPISLVLVIGAFIIITAFGFY